MRMNTLGHCPSRPTSTRLRWPTLLVGGGCGLFQRERWRTGELEASYVVNHANQVWVNGGM